MAHALKEYRIQGGYWRDGLAWCETALAADAGVDPAGAAELLAAAGHMAISLARWDQGRELLRASITSSDTAGAPPVALALDALAVDALEANQPDAAIRFAEASVNASRRRGDRFWDAYTLVTLSLMASLTSDDVSRVRASRTVRQAGGCADCGGLGACPCGLDRTASA